MNKQKKYGMLGLILVLSCFSVLLLAGCEKTETPPVAQADDVITLSTASMLGEGDGAEVAYQKLLADFQEANEKIKIEDESTISTEEWKKSIIQRFADDSTTPDVIFYFIGADAKSLLDAGEFVSIETIQKEYPNYAKNIRPSTMFSVTEPDGNHYGVPVRGFWEGLYCNNDLFKKYEVALPTDWQSLINAIEIFNSKGIVPIAASLGEVPHYWIEHSILAQGGAMNHRLSPTGSVADIWVLGLKEFKHLYDLKAFPANTMEILNTDAQNMFVNKEAAMILSGSWMYPMVTDLENTLVLPMPKTPSGQKEYSDIISGFSSGFYITKKAWDDPLKRQAAVDFVMHMTSNDSIAYICQFGGAPAVNVPTDAGSDTLAVSIGDLQLNAKNSIMPIDSHLSKEAWQYLCQQIKPMMLNEVQPQQIVQEVSRLNQTEPK